MANAPVNTIFFCQHMRKCYFFVLLFLFFACNTKNNNEINLFNNNSFKLHSGESLKDITPCITEMYTEYFNTQQIQIPLFKYIKHVDYVIFIGIPYNTSIDKMVNLRLNKPDSCHAILERNTTGFFNKYKKNGYYISEYSAVLENKSMIYISAMSYSKVISDSLFNKAEIIKRIKIIK